MWRHIRFGVWAIRLQQFSAIVLAFAIPETHRRPITTTISACQQTVLDLNLPHNTHPFAVI